MLVLLGRRLYLVDHLLWLAAYRPAKERAHHNKLALCIISQMGGKCTLDFRAHLGTRNHCFQLNINNHIVYLPKLIHCLVERTLLWYTTGHDNISFSSSRRRRW